MPPQSGGWGERMRDTLARMTAPEQDHDPGAQAAAPVRDGG